MPVSYPGRKRSSRPPTEEALGYRRILQEKAAAREAREASVKPSKKSKSSADNDRENESGDL